MQNLSGKIVWTLTGWVAAATHPGLRPVVRGMFGTPLLSVPVAKWLNNAPEIGP